MATPFQIAWTFLKSLPYDDEYEDENHRAIVEGGEHVGDKRWAHPRAPRLRTQIPSPDDAQDNYAIDEKMNEGEFEDFDNIEDYNEEDRDATSTTPLSEEEMYALFTQSQVPQNEGWNKKQAEQKEDMIYPW